MKGIIECDLDDSYEAVSYERALKSNGLNGAIFDFDQQVLRGIARGKTDADEKTQDIYIHIREQLWEYISDYYVEGN